MPAKFRRLLYDIETSPNIGLFWSAGYKRDIPHENIVQERRIITIAWKWHKERKVHALDWGSNQNDKAMLQEFIPILGSADESVAHYGDWFDLRWLKTRSLFHGIPTLPKYVTIDTKAWASKYFLFNSNKLDYLSKFLGRKGKLHTDFDLWKRILLHNDPKALRYMVRYDKQDVRELEYVFDRMAPHVPHRTHVGVLQGGAKWTCPNNRSHHVHLSRTRVTARGTKQFQMQCQVCGKYYSISEPSYEAYKKTLRR